MNHHEEKEMDDYTVVFLRSFSAPLTVFVKAESVEQAQELARAEIPMDPNHWRLVFVALGHHHNVAVY